MLSMADDLTTIIEEQIVTPASFSEEGRSESSRSIDDLIKVQQQLAAVAAVGKRRRGIGFTKQIPPGAMADGGGLCPPGPGYPFGGGV